MLLVQAMVDLSQFVGRVTTDAEVTCELREVLNGPPTAQHCGTLVFSVSSGVLNVQDPTSAPAAAGAPSSCMSGTVTSLCCMILTVAFV